MKAKLSNESQAKEQKIEVDGVVVEVLPDTKYVVEIKIGELTHRLFGYPSGKIRKNYIRLSIGDEVKMEISPKYDISQGRITWKKSNKREQPLVKTEPTNLGVQNESPS